jgi:hypothetical protein
VIAHPRAFKWRSERDPFIIISARGSGSARAAGRSPTCQRTISALITTQICGVVSPRTLTEKIPAADLGDVATGAPRGANDDVSSARRRY